MKFKTFFLRVLRLLPIKKFYSCCTSACFLYFFNAILVIYTIKVYLQADDHRDYDAYREEGPPTVDEYLGLIDRSMEIFDFVRKQQAGLLPVHTQLERGTIGTNACWPWFQPSKPEKSQINIKAGVWQEILHANTEIYLLSAYYDTRTDVRVSGTSGFVRILGMGWRSLRNVHLFCYVWYETGKVFIVQAMLKEIWERHWDPRDTFYVPHLFSCPLPDYLSSRGTPKFISLALEPCSSNITTLLPVNYDLPAKNQQRKHTVVCVKGMDFLSDLSLRFVEWLEASYFLGADKIVVYTYAIHPRLQRIIDHYRHKRWVNHDDVTARLKGDVMEKNATTQPSVNSLGNDEIVNGRFLSVPLTLPGRMPDFDPVVRSSFIQTNRQQKRRSELIPYNDCLYRHLYTHEYLLIVDIDELIVPMEPHNTWADVLNALSAQQSEGASKFTAFSITNAFFFDNLTKISSKRKVEPSKNLHMLQHNVRSKSFSPNGLYGKSFMQIDNILTVFNHYPLHKLDLDDRLRPTFYVPVDMAQKNHYKATCPVESRAECPDLYAKTAKDHSLKRFQSDIQKSVFKVLKDLRWTET